MSDTSHGAHPWTQPPPAPPLPPGRVGGVFQKIIGPLSFNLGGRPQESQAPRPTHEDLNIARHRGSSRHVPSQTTAHKTSIPMAAIDINRARTHAILAGHEILKTVHVHDGHMVEDFNLRSGINSYASTHTSRSENGNHRREYLPAKDVVWSKGGGFDTIIATAALNGRIALYDVSRLSSSRIELAWIHEHTNQVNKLDFDPTGGYLLLSGSQDKTVRVWDIRERQTVRRKQTISIRHPVRDVRWSPSDVGEFALCTENGVIQRWDLRVPTNALLSINAHEKACYAIDWHPDGRHLVSGGFDKYVKVWDFKSDRRQKPTFSLRAPHAILNVRWRPPSQSADGTEKGQWQTTQLATSYNDDDPRIHIWDLRRPLLPFREHDKYGARPTDMLWASPDFLWSVGTQGMFTQTDLRDIASVHDDLSVSANQFLPDGSFVAFSENTHIHRQSSSDDSAANFLSLPREKLSGGTDGAISRSFSEDDDGEDAMLSTSLRRRISRSSRSAKSQANTPPNGDGLVNVVPFDRAVLSRYGLFNNQQSGLLSSVSGIAAEPEIVEFLADNYARPLALEDGRFEPYQILDKLCKAFQRNADVCDYVSMHRVAQVWRILEAVVVPELQEWADGNRRLRIEANLLRKVSPSAVRLNARAETAPASSISLQTKIVNNLFKGVSRSERCGLDQETSSGMTTPTAKPLPDSPPAGSRKQETVIPSLREVVEPIQQLPPSVISAHSTAAAASRALFDTSNDNSPASSPERLRRPPLPSLHKRSITDTSGLSTERLGSQMYNSNLLRPKQVSSPITPASPRMELRKQEDRRAALRDFRGQQRQLFTFEESVRSPRYSNSDRHDSSESFPMFSASTDSSHRAKSFGQSFDVSRDRLRRYQNSRDLEDWQSVQYEEAIESLPSGSSESLLRQSKESLLHLEDENMQEDFPMDESSRSGPQSHRKDDSKRMPDQPKPSAAAKLWNIGDLKTISSKSRSETTESSASEEVSFPLEEISNIKRPTIYTSNPLHTTVPKPADGVTENSEQPLLSLEIIDANSDGYVTSDFRPIDFTVYEPKLPFAWSALPLICHSIAFDVTEGIACAQFSVHLLLHLYPFFFACGNNASMQQTYRPPEGLAERLMRPDLNQRVIEGCFLNHYLYLKKLRLFNAMSEVRKTCEYYGFVKTFDTDGSDQPVGSALKQDPYRIPKSCIHCHNLMQPGTTVCQTCGKPGANCPICLQLHPTNHQQIYNTASKQSNDTGLQSSQLWVFCQSCGHSAHWQCMQDWMHLPDAQGECPTLGCGCDCGEGMTRHRRITRQQAETEANDMIRGGAAASRSSSSATAGNAFPKKDPSRASHSPAVDKTRNDLRNSDGVRENSSGEERVRRSFSGRSSAAGGGRGGTGGNGAGGGGGGSVSVSGAPGRGGMSGSSVGGGSVGGGGVGNTRGATSQSFGRRVRLVTPGEESGP